MGRRGIQWAQMGQLGMLSTDLSTDSMLIVIGFVQKKNQTMHANSPMISIVFG
jgi:hypothetical protein